MMNQEHVLPKLSDYVLDLLPGGERRQVEQHAAECAACRTALQTERQIGGLVRASLQAASEPRHGRLGQLRPGIAPVRPAQSGFWLARQRQLALVGLLLVLLLGTLGLRYSSARQSWQPPLPTSVAATATTTASATRNGATATLAQTLTSTRMAATTVSSTLAAPAARSHLHPTPIPLPTPVAVARPPLAAN